MDKALEQAGRTRCAANLDAIASAAVHYALENQQELFICRARSVTIAFNRKGAGASASVSDQEVDWPAALASVGLVESTKTRQPSGVTENTPLKTWACPSRGYKSNWDTRYAAEQMIISYRYFGGIETWTNSEGTFEANAPLKISDGGSLTLASDLPAKINGKFGGADHDKYHWGYAAPAHRRGRNTPEGQNQAYLDASVEFVGAARLAYIHAWYADINNALYLWQRNLGGYQPRADLYLVNDPAYQP